LLSNFLDEAQFIRETLYGYDNQTIQVLKFRAASVEGDQISPLGQILSQSGIDELPQLFNVVRGEMSIFGRRDVHRWPASMS
jgi:lipopolysaccharide/colanic/teichoic acid biosynthesis glycosyltransferase